MVGVVAIVAHIAAQGDRAVEVGVDPVVGLAEKREDEILLRLAFYEGAPRLVQRGGLDEAGAQVSLEVERGQAEIVAASRVRREAQGAPIGKDRAILRRVGRRHQPAHRGQHGQQGHQGRAHQPHHEGSCFRQVVEVDDGKGGQGQHDAQGTAQLEQLLRNAVVGSEDRQQTDAKGQQIDEHQGPRGGRGLPLRSPQIAEGPPHGVQYTL